MRGCGGAEVRGCGGAEVRGCGGADVRRCGGGYPATCSPPAGANKFAAGKAQSPPARTRRHGRVRRPMHRRVRNRMARDQIAVGGIHGTSSEAAASVRGSVGDRDTLVAKPRERVRDGGAAGCHENFSATPRSSSKAGRTRPPRSPDARSGEPSARTAASGEAGRQRPGARRCSPAPPRVVCSARRRAVHASCIRPAPVRAQQTRIC